MLMFKWEAALHNKPLDGVETEKESELTPEQEKLLDQAMEAAVLRKRMEANRGRSHHKN